MARRVDVTKRSTAARPAISLDDGVPPPEQSGVDLLPKPLPSSEQQDARNRTRSRDWADKVIVVGESSVGKTNLIMKYCSGGYSEDFKSTIGVDFFWQKYKHRDYEFTLNIWDTAGQERFRAISSTYYRGAHACILAFDLGDPNSFQKMKRWAGDVIKHNQAQLVLFFLVGCKADMFHAVKHEQGLKMAQELNAEYFEVSAKTGDNVPWLFNRVAYVLLQYKIQTCMQPPQPFPSAFKSKVAPIGGGKGIGSTSAGKGTENWKEKHSGKVLSLKGADANKKLAKGPLFKC
ncbi:unnamed protein product [Closterium sp. NIES-64]|nr:unnamed protein product [Closterium sp. NIES-65]CAI5994251.1 unnamed protein product [Closterium sp. NIES-64]